MIDDLLYVIARDNEREMLLQELEKRSEWFLHQIVQQSLIPGEVDLLLLQRAHQLLEHEHGDVLEVVLGELVEIEEYEKDLHTKVNRFKAWTKENFPAFSEENDNGEWCFCDEFFEM